VPGLLLLRHAQSAWNADGRWQGWADPPLSSEGEAQIRRAAHSAAGHLAAARPATGQEPFDRVVSSDLARARRTAELLTQALDLAAPLHVEPGLREYDVGEWSGCTLAQIEARWPGAVARFSRGEIAAPGGEARADFDARVGAAARRVGAAAHAAGVRGLLVVAHGGVIRALARAAGQAEYRVGHLAGYWGEYGEGGLFPEEPVNLLDPEVPEDAGEASAVSGS